jgi:hypothetical protein
MRVLVSSSSLLLGLAVIFVCKNGAVVVSAQRFLREGSQMAAENRAEVELEDEDSGLSGMTREMFLMQDVQWELQPPCKVDTAALCQKNKDNKKVAKQVQDYLKEPIRLRLLRRNGKYGLKAIGTTPSGKKIRAFWRQASPSVAFGPSSSSPTTTTGRGTRLKAADFLEVSYDDAVRSRLFVVDFELQLPRTKSSSPNSKSTAAAPPSIVYQVPIEVGSMNPKAMVARGEAKVKVFPVREKGTDGDSIQIGTAKVGLTMKPGLVDPNWARGKTILRCGRSTGFV